MSLLGLWLFEKANKKLPQSPISQNRYEGTWVRPNETKKNTWNKLEISNKLSQHQTDSAGMGQGLGAIPSGSQGS